MAEKNENKKKSWLRRNFITIILVLMMITGFCLILYPTVSDYWNSFHQSRAIAAYVETVADLSDEEYEKVLSSAREYNKKIAENGINFTLSDDQLKEYNSQLNIGGSGIMGYIEIDKINCYLPIYHGTDEGVLQIAIGHIEGTSLPVGGESTHCVLSGHRGLPSAKLFTRLDELEEGDTFVIRTLDDVLTYEVDQIRIVLPEDTSNLTIEEGKDLVTLVTCTPYGVNDHRLLVRGHRIATTDDSIRVTADAQQIDPVIVAPFASIPLLLVLLIILIHTTRKNKKNHKKENVENTTEIDNSKNKTKTAHKENVEQMTEDSVPARKTKKRHKAKAGHLTGTDDSAGSDRKRHGPKHNKKRSVNRPEVPETSSTPRRHRRHNGKK